MQPPEMPTAGPLPPPPPGAEPVARPRSRRPAILIAAAIGLALIAGVAALAILGGDDGPYPGSLDELVRIRSSAADTFEESLDTFAAGDVRLSGAMYGAQGGAPSLIVERLEGPEEQVAVIPLQQTFDGAVLGFESSGAGEIDEGSSVHETRSGFEIICAQMRVLVSDPAMPQGDGVLCSWKGTRIGIVIDLRTSDPDTAIDVTGRIAAVIDAA